MLNDCELSAIDRAYSSVWSDYQKMKRRRNVDKDDKERYLRFLRKTLKTLQHIITVHLETPCKFKDV